MGRVDRRGQLVAVDRASEQGDRADRERQGGAERDGMCERQRVDALFQPGTTCLDVEQDRLANDDGCAS